MKKAFTLIELIVVVSISMMFFGLTLARYNNNAGQLKLKNEAKKLVDVFELAKKKALSADLPITPGPIPTFCPDFTGYQIKILEGSYSLLFGCASVYTPIQNYNLTSNISIISGTGDYNFPPLMNNPNFSDSSIVFYNSAIGKYVEVTVSPIGIVTFVDSILSSLPLPTNTPIPPTPVPTTPIPPTSTPVPPTSTPIPPTPIPPTSTPVPPTPTTVPICANFGEYCRFKACCSGYSCVGFYCEGPTPTPGPTATPIPIPPTPTPIPCWATNNVCDSACTYNSEYYSCGSYFPYGTACSSNGTGTCFKKDLYNTFLVCYYDSQGNCNLCSDLGQGNYFDNSAIQCTWKF